MSNPPGGIQRLTRRDLLRLGGGTALATMSLSGCSFFSTDPTSSSSGSDSGPKGKEAPALAEQVKAGKLPKVSERVPKSPLVLEPVDEIGQYGGTWQSVILNLADTPWLQRTLGGENLLRWDPMWEHEAEPLPNVAEQVDVSDDGRVFTIHLRQGLKWSDGEPYTADDMVFAVQDFSFNTELNPVTPVVLTSLGERCAIRKLDDYTAEITFPRPAGLFLSRLAVEGRFTTTPKHYMEQFHKKYNKDVEKLAKDEKFASWVELFTGKNDGWVNSEKPTLNPWMIVNPLGEGNQVVAERNPYYWKVDPDGSQLPYLDRVTYDVVTEKEAILLKATNGELDFSTRHINTLQNKPVLANSRAEGQYHFIDLQNTVTNDLVLSLNMNHKNAELRNVFQNKDFRVGLSHAINREEMIDSVWQRAGEPWQAAPARESEYFDEEFAKQYTEYDLAKANDYLDRAGLTKKDSDGIRLLPSGKKLAFQVDVASPALTPVWVDGTDLVCAYWRKVGVEARPNVIDRTLFYERKDTSNTHDANVWMGDGGGPSGEILECRWYFPFSSESNYAEIWRTYYESFGETGEKPPADTLKQMELYWDLLVTPDLEERKSLLRQILQIAKEQFYVIGTVRVARTYGIVKDNFHNVPKLIPEASVFNTPYPVQPAQFFVT
jgi:peptide/nickel transport system substrate-binding protein